MGVLLVSLFLIVLACILGFPIGFALRVCGILGLLLAALGAWCADESKGSIFFLIAIPAVIILLLGISAGDMNVLDLLLMEC